jgi:transposase
VVVVGREGVIAHDVTLGAYNTNKFLEFIQTKVIPSLDEQRFIFIYNVPFHRPRKIQQAFEDVGHIYFHLPSYAPFLNVAKWIFGHIKSHIQ